MQHNSISPLITQNRLLSQARSGTRARSAAIGSALQRSNSSNNSSSNTKSATKKENSLMTESRENFTALKKAAEEVKENSKGLRDILGQDFESMTEEEAALNRTKAEEKIVEFIDSYNSLIKNLEKENAGANATYLSQLKEYFSRSSKALGEMGITAGSNGILSVNRELLKSADLSNLKASFGTATSFAGKVATRSENIIANAETSLAVLNKNLNSGNYTYNRTGSDIYDILNGSSKYNEIG